MRKNMFENVLNSFKKNRKVKLYGEIIEDLLEFNQYLNYEVEKSTDFDEMETIHQAKHNIMETIRVIKLLAEANGIQITKIMFNDVEVDV